MARLPLFTTESAFNPEQRRVVDGILGRRGGRIPGPYRLSLHDPLLTEVWHPLGEHLRLKSSFPLRFTEFVIVTTARAWDCDYVFGAHSKIALEAGVSLAVIEAMQRDERPQFDNAEEADAYDYLMELIRGHAVSDATYAKLRARYNEQQMVELTALSGYYSMVAMTVIAHDMPLAAENRKLEKHARR